MKTASFLLGFTIMVATISGQGESSSDVSVCLPEGESVSSSHFTSIASAKALSGNFYEDDYSEVVTYRKGDDKFDILYATEDYEKQYRFRHNIMNEGISHTLSNISDEGHESPQCDDDDYDYDDYDYDYEEEEWELDIESLLEAIQQEAREKGEKIKSIYDLIAETREYDRFEIMLMVVVHGFAHFVTCVKFITFIEMAVVFDDEDCDTRGMVRWILVAWTMTFHAGYMVGSFDIINARTMMLAVWLSVLFVGLCLCRCIFNEDAG